MKPKLKENPREWQNFTTASAVALGLAAILAQRRGILPAPPGLIAIVCAIPALLCWVRPGWFRGFYRAGMTVGFWLGQFVGRILLTLLFWIVLTPMACGLRLAGKDLLNLRKRPSATSYWHEARNEVRLDRLF